MPGNREPERRCGQLEPADERTPAAHGRRRWGGGGSDQGSMGIVKMAVASGTVEVTVAAIRHQRRSTKHRCGKAAHSLLDS